MCKAIKLVPPKHYFSSQISCLFMLLFSSSILISLTVKKSIRATLNGGHLQNSAINRYLQSLETYLRTTLRTPHSQVPFYNFSISSFISKQSACESSPYPCGDKEVCIPDYQAESFTCICDTGYAGKPCST